jgi:hypothetical protein
MLASLNTWIKEDCGARGEKRVLFVARFVSINADLSLIQPDDRLQDSDDENDE